MFEIWQDFFGLYRSECSACYSLSPAFVASDSSPRTAKVLPIELASSKVRTALYLESTESVRTFQSSGNKLGS